MCRFKNWIGLVAAACSFVGSVQADDAKITYDDHIKPIFREHCLACHNNNDKKGGLALDSYAATIEGGSGGEVAVAGDLASSRLWELTAHIAQPYMPPNQDKIADNKLDLLKKWIETGLLENSGSVAKKPKAASAALATFSLGKPEGELPMPKDLLLQPVVFTPRSAAITAIAASPWSPLVAVGGQKQVSLYSTDTGELLGILPFPEGEPQSITYSRDGRLILVGGGKHSQSGCAVLFDIQSGKRVAKVGDELDIVLSADLSEDNSKVVLGGPQKMVRVYSTATGDKLFEMKKHTDWIYSVRFSPDGVLIASADRSNGLVVWEADTGRFYLDLVGHRGEIREIAWRPDSNVLTSASADGTVRMWEMFNGGQIKAINAHGAGVTSVAFSTNGTMVTGGRDRVVRVWNSNGDPIKELPAMSEAVLEVAVTSDPMKVIAGDWNGNVSLWQLDDPTKTFTLAANPPSLDASLSLKVAALEAARAEFAPLSTNVVALTQALTAVQGELAGANTLVEQTNAKLAETTKQRDEAKALLADQDAKLPTLTENVDAAKQERQATADRLAGLEAQVVAVTAEQQAAVAKVAEVTTKVTAAQQALEQGNAAAAAGAAKVAAAEQAVVKTTLAREKFLRMPSVLQAEGQNLLTQAASLEESAKPIAAERDAKTAKVNEIAAQIAQLQAQLKALQDSVAQNEASKGQLGAEVQQSQQKIDAIQAQVDDLKAKSEEANQRLKEFQEAYGSQTSTAGA